MAAIDFPNSPTINQLVIRGGYTWIWNGQTWKKVVGGGASTSISTFYGAKFTPSSGRLQIDYDDLDDGTSGNSFVHSDYEDWFIASQAGGLNFTFDNHHLVMETN